MNINQLVSAINQKMDVAMTDKEIIDYMQLTLVGEEVAVLPEEFIDQLVEITISRIKESAPSI